MRNVPATTPIALVALLLSGVSVGQAQSCGVVSLFDLSQLVGSELSDEERKALVEGYPAEESSMLDIKQAAERLDLPLVGVAAALEELTTDVPGPKIIHLNDPAHFLVVARASDEWVQLLDGGRVVVVPRAEIEKRYSGHALILDQAQFPEGGPRLEAPEFHHTFGIAGIGQEVEHAFTVRNVGDQELVVRPQEKGCCGAPKVTISRQSLPPGESAEVAQADVRLRVVTYLLLVLTCVIPRKNERVGPDGRRLSSTRRVRRPHCRRR